MKITLLTAASPSYWELMKVTAPNKLDYCLKHNVQLSIREHDDVEKERVEFMKAALHQTDWLWFMGTDTLIMNQTIDVRQFLDPEYDFIIGEDINGINNDVFFLRNNMAGHSFLDQVRHLNKYCNHDQDSMFGAIESTIGLRTKIVHQKQFNSFKYDEYNYPDDGGGSYSDGDFVLHLPALTNERRIKLFTEYLKQVKK